MLDQMNLFADIGAADYRDSLTLDERATIEAARDILRRHVTGRCVITSWHALCDYLATTGGALRSESMRVLYLDKKNRLIRDEEAGRGTVDHVPVYPREIMRRAMQLDASAIILTHNHPSGDTTPSAADIAMTKEIARAAEALGITVHDHVITGGADTFSFKANGLF